MSSDAPDVAAALLTAAEAGDLDRLREVRRRLAERSPSELLSDLATAIEERRYDDAEVLYTEVGQRYADRRPEKEALRSRIEAAMAEPSTGYDRTMAYHSFLETASDVEMQRAKLLSGVGPLLEAPEADDAPDPATMAETVRQTRSDEATLDDERSSVRDDLSDVSLPARLSVSGAGAVPSAVADGSSVELAVQVRNVGDAAATDVSLSFESPSGLSTSPSSIDLGRIGPAGVVERSTTVSGESGGNYTLTTRATGAEAGTSIARFSVVVTDDADGDPAGPIERADTNDDGEISTNELQTAIGEWVNGGYTTGELQRIIAAWVDGG